MLFHSFSAFLCFIFCLLCTNSNNPFVSLFPLCCPPSFISLQRQFMITLYIVIYTEKAFTAHTHIPTTTSFVSSKGKLRFVAAHFFIFGCCFFFILLFFFTSMEVNTWEIFGLKIEPTCSPFKTKPSRAKQNKTYDVTWFMYYNNCCIVHCIDVTSK